MHISHPALKNGQNIYGAVATPTFYGTKRNMVRWIGENDDASSIHPHVPTATQLPYVRWVTLTIGMKKREHSLTTRNKNGNKKGEGSSKKKF